MSDPTDPVLFTIHFFPGVKPLVLTAWKMVGFGGGLMFAGRWVVQALASRYAKRPVLPNLFWYMSLCGSLMILSYFIWGKNDSVGIITNLLPAAVALYNLSLDRKHRAVTKSEKS